ncbi:50S ribosomal protein L18e [Candidatus Pacearchaeota archaeon]|nr:50S ribosomal protein L18e [Candidatus Pacearchaeota archaeon]
MKISKSKIERKLKRKTNAHLVKLIIRLKKTSPSLANLISIPRRKRAQVNLEKINKNTKENDVVVVPGKVLGKGKIHHSIIIAALSFSEEAERKLKEAKCKIEGIEGVLHHKTLKVIK